MNKNQKGFARYNSISGFTHLFLVVIIVLIGIAGILYYSWQKGLIKTTSTQDAIPTPTGIIKETISWKTFENDEYQIKYPPDWLLGPFSGGGREPDEETKKRGEIIITNYYIPDDPIRSLTGDGVRIEIIIEEINPETGDAFEKYVDDIRRLTLSDKVTNLSEETIQFAGHRAIKTDGEFKNEEINYRILSIFIDKTNKVYWIGYTLNSQNDNNEQTINQILSTFRFIN